MNEKEYQRRKEKAKPAYDALMKFYPFNVADLQGEIWRPVPDYEQLYHVSNYGRVKSFWLDKVKILKPTLNAGYLHVNFYKDGKHRNFDVHRLVASAFLHNPDNKPQVNHKDGNRLNNHVSNLEWVTASENQRHAHDIGLAKHAQGQDSVLSKLTNEQVRYIRNNPDRLTLEKLAEKFGVCQQTISEIQIGKTYRNAGGNLRKAQKCTPRLSDEVRAQIRADWATGQYSKAALARKYGVCPQTIRNIINEK